jgi:hypothetical protein
MRKILFLMTLFIPLAASAQAPEGMYWCQKDSDCIVVEDFCKNNWRAIASTQVKVYEDWAAEMKPVIECLPLKASPKPSPECDGNRCIVHSPVPGEQ